MAGSIARQPWRLGTMLLLLFIAVVALLVFQAFTSQTPDQDAAEVSETVGAAQITETAIPLAITPPAPPAAISGPGAATDPGFFSSETVFIDFSNPGDDPSVPEVPATGTLAGRVWQEDIMDGIVGGITVYLATGSGVLTGRQASTDAGGAFRFEGIAPGDYRLYFLDPHSVYQPGWYGSAETPGGTPIRVNSGGGPSVKHRLKVSKEEGYGAIRGRVTDESGAGVPGVDVFAYAVEGGSLQLLDLRGHAITDTLGYYSLQKLPPAYSLHEPKTIVGYKIQFNPVQGWAQQWYQGQSTHDTAKIIPLAYAEEVTGIDAVLESGGTISGSVSGGGEPLRWTLVDIYDSSGLIAASVLTDSAGGFHSGKLAPGEYKIHVGGGDDFSGEWYNDKSDFAGADPVFVITGHDSGGISIGLQAKEKKEKPLSSKAVLTDPVQQFPGNNVAGFEAPHGAGQGAGGAGAGGSAAGQAPVDETPDGIFRPDEHEDQVPAQRGEDQTPHRQAEAHEPGQPGAQFPGKDL